MTVEFRFLACVFASLLTAAATAGADKAVAVGYRGPQRDGIYRETGLLKEWPKDGLSPVWVYKGLGEGYSALAVADGTVYGIGKHYENGKKVGRIKAISLDGGQEMWDSIYGPEFGAGAFEGPRSAVEVADGRAYFASGQGVVYCCACQDGKTVWSVDIETTFGRKPQGWGYIETPLLVNDMVVFSPCPASNNVPPVVAVDRVTGKIRWTAKTAYAGYTHGGTSAMAFQAGDRTVIVHQLDKLLLALDAADGSELWKIETTVPGFYYVTPVYQDGHLLCWVKNLTLLKISDGGKTHEKVWDGLALESKGQATILGGSVYGFGQTTVEGKNCLAWTKTDLARGTLVKAEPCMDEGSVVAADGLLYWVEGGKTSAKTPRISLVKPGPDGFQLLGRFNIPPGKKELWTSPTIAAGRLLIRHGSQVAAYDIRAK